MRIPFTKAHGAKNDFLLTWQGDAACHDMREAAIAICNRHTGVGADGWMLVSPAPKGETAFHGSIQLFNSDGSDAEISGNGTRCAAAFLIDAGLGGEDVYIRTGAGVKLLKLLSNTGRNFQFEMNMGRPQFLPDPRLSLDLSGGSVDSIVVDVGNPQCVLVVNNFDNDWRGIGAEIERHPHFPNRTNVSFLRRVDAHTIDVRFYERGAGETLSSGTGSTGAAAVALRLGLVKNPVTVLTPAGPLAIRAANDIFLTGPAEIVAGGEFYFGE
ncbi:MAG: diaminopimelate epimerase [Bryobacteraceae bacterium]